MPQRKRILAVDDDRTILRGLGCLPRSADFDVVTATDGQQALEVAELETPDLILLDLRMPGFDGFSVLKKLKESAKTREIPVIVLSANVTALSSPRLLELGARFVVQKPYNAKELIAVIDQTLAEKSAPTTSQVAK